MPRDDVFTAAPAPTGDALRQMIRNRIGRAEDGKLSQAEIARQADIPPSTLSQYLNDKYPGDTGPVEQKLTAFLATQHVAADVGALLPRLPAYVDTPTGARIIDALSYAQASRNIACIFGGAGVGKTRTLRHYRRTHSSVWVVTCDPMLAQMGALLDHIAEVLGLADGRRDPPSLRRRIVARLKGTGGLLVFDEVQHLTDKALEALRAIHDGVNADLDDDDAPGLGMAWVGNTILYARVTGQKRAEDFAQVTRRIGKFCKVERPTKGDVRAIAAAFGLTGREELEAVEEIASRPGALGLVHQVLRQAWLLAAADVPPGRPTVDLIRTALTDLQRDAG